MMMMMTMRNRTTPPFQTADVRSCSPNLHRLITRGVVPPHLPHRSPTGSRHLLLPAVQANFLSTSAARKATIPSARPAAYHPTRNRYSAAPQQQQRPLAVLASWPVVNRRRLPRISPSRKSTLPTYSTCHLWHGRIPASSAVPVRFPSMGVCSAFRITPTDCTYKSPTPLRQANCRRDRCHPDSSGTQTKASVHVFYRNGAPFRSARPSVPTSNSPTKSIPI